VGERFRGVDEKKKTPELQPMNSRGNGRGDVKRRKKATPLYFQGLEGKKGCTIKNHLSSQTKALSEKHDRRIPRKPQAFNKTKWDRKRGNKPKAL